jgi:hypothetical protein
VEVWYAARFFLKLAISIIGVLVLILCFWIPELANAFIENNPEFLFFRYPILAGIYTAAIPFYLALYQALKLLNIIESNNAFSELAVNSLRVIKYCAVAIVIIYTGEFSFLGIQKLLHPGVMTMGVTIIFAALTISFFAGVPQELLINALQIKSENAFNSLR